jgi:glycosyltransferase involved in cell wall biosynthesis
MKICFLEGDMSRRGGTERMTSILANALCEEYEVYIVSLKHLTTVPFFYLHNSVFLHSLSDGENGILGQIKNLRSFVKANHFDWLINVDIGTAIYGIPATFGTKTKVVTWEHGNYYNDWGSRWIPRFRRFAAKHSNSFVVLTEKDRSNYLSHIHTKKSFYVIPNPVVRHDYTYDLDSKTILSAGLLTPIKGFDQAIEIASIVLKRHPDWRWIICGNGPERERLESMAVRFGLEEQLYFAGSVNNMDEQYRKSAMFVMTSRMEGLPMVLLEAKSWGLPLISYDIMTGPSDIIRDGENGFLVRQGDTKQMAVRIEDLICNTEKRKMFSAASQLDMDRFSTEGIIEKWIKLLSH